MTETRPRIQAVVFDLDDTLFLERDYVRSGYRAVGEHLRAALGREDCFEAWLWRRFQAGESAHAFDALNERFRLRLSETQVAGLIAVYRDHRPVLRPAGGAGEMLSRLRPRVALGLLSDGYLPAQHHKLEALGLREFFDAVVFTEQLGREFWKPAPKAFSHVADLLHAPPEACAYVGDNPAKDFVAPNRLGWLTVQFRRPGQIHADRPAPEDGRPLHIVHTGGELWLALIGAR